MTETFFEQYDTARSEDGLVRDRWGRPLLVPAGMKGVRTPYTRASSLGDYVTDKRAIHTWERRYLARGMGMREDLAALAAAETYTTGFGEQDVGDNRASGRRLDDVITRALDTARVHERADYGTAVHLLTEPGSRGTVPERMKADVASFPAYLAEQGIEILDTELFVANDEFMAAGTFDHLVYAPGLGFCILDKKTGRLGGLEWAVQLAVYAGGELYDPDSDRRMSLECLIDAWSGPGEAINQDFGIIAHIPAGEGRTVLYTIDLRVGREFAAIAARVREAQKRRDLLVLRKDFGQIRREELLDLIKDMTTQDELSALWRQNQAVWSDELTTAGRARISELEATA